MTREEAIEILQNIAWSVGSVEREQIQTALDMAIEALSADAIESISENTIVVKYADYEDIGRIILTNGDIFCKIFYEDARQNDDSDYDSLVPDEYKTEPKERGDAEMNEIKNPYYMQQSRHDDGKDIISRADAVGYETTATINEPISIQSNYVYVVRCKDCRHGWYDDDIEYYTCRHPKGLNEELYGVDFCSYGERREK